MNAFSFTQVSHESQAIAEINSAAGATIIAGGTTLLDLMKLGVQVPTRLVDVNKLPLNNVVEIEGGVRIEANVRNSDLAYHKLIQEKYPLLSEALLSGASPQLRNMATTAGNLLQRTRCPYFRDTSYRCNKRTPGSGCDALDGYNRSHALLGISNQCIATHPSDMCVAMAALDAVIVVHTKRAGEDAITERKIPFDQFYIPYGDDPAKENVLLSGDLIVAVEIPSHDFGKRAKYLKVRDRASYEFALASAAVMLNISGDTIHEARIALGGVATKPWRARDAENALKDKRPDSAAFAQAADAALQNAAPRKYNAFKVELTRRVIVQALTTVAAMHEGSAA